MTDKTLYSPINLGSIQLKNRIVMAPLTRCRADDEGVLPDMARQYYQQRATAGLIITEATQISAQGKGYPNTPGIYTDDHVSAWKNITQAVHAENGKIVLQLWHVGRISYPGIQENGAAPIAPSAIKAEGDYVEPRAITLAEIPTLLESYKHAAQCAYTAGFDGVEIHAANGYLLDQFLRDSTNKRKDNYGGNVENRTRLLIEVIESVKEIWPENKIGVRLSPIGTFNDIKDSAPSELFNYIVKQLNNYDLAYLHVLENEMHVNAPEAFEFNPKSLKHVYNGNYIGNVGYTKTTAESAIQSGSADAISFGTLFISNPDLVTRFKQNSPLNEAKEEGRYGGTEVGYIDYPSL